MSSIVFLAFLLASLLLHDAKAEWAETGMLLDSDREDGDRFGFSVEMDNGFLVVGSDRDDIGGATQAGSVTIFELSEGEWVAQQKLAASAAASSDFFGFSVAISNGVVAVGAYGQDDGGSRAGAVYSYGKGAGGVWMEGQKLIHSGAAAGDEFGWSLAMHGNTLIVGARGDGSESGSVFIFTRSTDTWTQVAKLTASDRGADDQFGYSVAIDADTIIVGARYDDDMGTDSGSAYVFQRTGEGGAWTQAGKLTPSDGQVGDNFGRSVAIERGIVFVGSINNADGERVGGVYRFGEGGTWTQQNKLVARDIATNGRFGYGLAFRNGNLVVGAYGQNSGTGAVYVFLQESDDVWTQGAKLVASDGAAGDDFGYAVAVDDGMVVAGARGAYLGQGSVHVFESQPSRHPSVQRSAEASIMPSVITSVIPTGPTTRNPSTLAAAPIATQNSGLQPIAIVVFVGVAFLAGGVAVWIFSRRSTRAAAPNQDAPHNDHRVVITDDISELEDPSVENEILSVEASAESNVHTLNAGTASIDHSQQTSLF